MKQTENYGFEKPDIKEFFKLETWKNNMDKIDEAIKERETAQGVTDEEIKKIKNVQFTQADERKNIESKETLPVLFGKIARWIADLKTVAFSGSYNDLSNKPTIPTVVNNNTTTEAGYALDARQANPNVDGSLAKQISTLNSSLANHLPLSGGTMTGTIIGQHKLPGSTASDSNGMVLGVQTTGNTGIFNGNGDGNGADVANLIIKSWYGVGFVDGCSGQGMTVGIDCRSGNITCNSITIRNVGSVTDLLNSKLSTSASCNKNWNWSGKNETPAWIWGGSDGTNMYVYNPTYILVQGIRNRVTNRAMTITDDNHVRTYESNGVGMNGAISLGSGNYRFSQLYVTSSSISTSDKNYKDDIKSLTNKHLQFFMKLQPVSFLFKEGTSGRTHIGFIAQDVEQAMSECGLTDLDFAGFCKDQKIDSKLVDGEEVNEPILDENGNPEYIYSLRYEEFIALNTYTIQKLWNRVETLEKENAELKDQIKSIQQDITELKKSRA